VATATIRTRTRTRKEEKMASEVNDVRDPRTHVYMGIVRATILLTDGKDLIILNTNFPSPFNPEYDTSSLILQFEATMNKGEQYVKDNFPFVSYKIINSRTVPVRFPEIKKKLAKEV
jgi:hypothetical protein